MSQSALPNPFLGGAAFVMPATWQGVMKQVLHLAEFSGGLQVIDGARGSGKTVFAHHMASALAEEVGCGVLALPPGLPTAQVFDCLLTSLGIDVQDGQSIGQSIISLRQFDANLKREQSRKILIIDDAHHFDDQALAALASVFQGSQDTEVGLALIFLAEPGMAQRLDALHLVDVEVRDCVLPPMGEEDIQQLLEEEFQANAEGDFPFDEETVEAIHSESGGMPQDALRIASALWDQSQANKAVPIWKKLPVLHLVAIAALVLALLWGLISGFGREDEKEASVAPPVQFIVNSSHVMSSSSSLGEFSVSSQASEASFSTGVESLEIDSLEVESLEVESSNASLTDIEAVSSSVVSSLAQSSVAKTAPKAPEEPNRALEPKEPKSPSPAAIVIEPPKAESDPLLIDGLTDDEEALMKLPQRGFILQVLAANARESLERFVSEQPNRQNLRIYRSIRSGKSWFVVVEGYYADKDSAVAAISNLPNNQLKAGPWPKSIAAVKLEITAFKQQTP